MVLTVLAIFTLAALYWFPIRRWMNQWGATPSDLDRVMGGDGLLAQWTYSDDGRHRQREAGTPLAVAAADRVSAGRVVQLRLARSRMRMNLANM